MEAWLWPPPGWGLSSTELQESRALSCAPLSLRLGVWAVPRAARSSAERDHSIFSLEIFAGWELPNTYTDHKIISIKQPRNTLLGAPELPRGLQGQQGPKTRQGPNKGHRCAACISGPSLCSPLPGGGWQQGQVSGRTDKGCLSALEAHAGLGRAAVAPA